ncbi:FimV/HubP family polar landmark protein [Luteimonas sp. A277]
MRWRFAWTLVLVLMASPAFALGLGQIQVRSQHGEPLLAEIPIVSSDPNELRQLRVGLASPETFARIGLQPPQGVVRNLQFNVALDASGRPVVRVTSSAPVDQSLLTFLIEADWGQGRLVREYSALLDAPDAIAAPAQPSIQAPVVESGDRIIRPAQPAAESAAADGQKAAEPQAAPAPETVVGADDAAPVQPDPAPAPAPAPIAATPPPAAAAVGGELAPVQAGDTLSTIAQRLASEEGVTTNQMMLALLRTNPGAFIGGNINLLREGAVLRVPDRDDVLQQSTAQATAEVRSHVARWREMSAPQPQPMDPATAPGTATDQAADEIAEAAQAQRGTQTADARLEIAPSSSADGGQAGTRSGIAAGGEGEMLRQELQETRETLAARDAEVDELKMRLADLEQLQGKQQQLIELKDSELAAVQQRLAESNQQFSPSLAQANESGAGAPETAQGGSGAWLWIGLGVVLILAAAVVWLRSRRDGESSSGPTGAGGRRRATATPAWHAGSAGVAAGVTAGGALSTEDGAPAAMDAGHEPDGPVVAVETDDGPGEPVPAAGSWQAEVPGSIVEDPLPPAAPVPVPEPEPVPAQTPSLAADLDEPSAHDLLAGAGERLELAKAYVELGDIDTARDLLGEVVGSGNPIEAAEAERLLVELA